MPECSECRSVQKLAGVHDALDEREVMYALDMQDVRSMCMRHWMEELDALFLFFSG